MPSRCTLTTIAQAVGVSVSTVSYALRGDPRILPATTARIVAEAKRLGYRPNPAVAALMTHIRAGRAPSGGEKLAFVWIEGKGVGEHRSYKLDCWTAARERAEELGYGLEEFSLTTPKMKPLRLSEILKARGITGVVFSPSELKADVNLQMDWAAHAMAIIGNARWNPALHRAGHFHYMGMRRIMLELAMRAYTRPMAVFEDAVNRRANHSCEAAFLTFHPTPHDARPLLHPQTRFDPDAVRTLIETHRPDALIVTTQREAAVARKVCESLSFEAGIVALQTAEVGTIAGIAPDHAQVAANAVELVASQLQRNERGVPSNPKELLLDGHWVEGNSLRSRCAEAPPDAGL